MHPVIQGSVIDLPIIENEEQTREGAGDERGGDK